MNSWNRTTGTARYRGVTFTFKNSNATWERLWPHWLAVGPRQVKNSRDSNLNDSTAPQCLLLGLFAQKVFETNLNFRYQRVENLNFCYVNFKSHIYVWLLYFFRFLCLFVPKIVSNDFWTKIPKTSHCAPMHFFAFAFAVLKSWKHVRSVKGRPPISEKKRQEILRDLGNP